MTQLQNISLYLLFAEASQSNVFFFFMGAAVWLLNSTGAIQGNTNDSRWR